MNPITTSKYIIRTDRAGVFFSEITERRGSEVDLVNARRIHYWQGATECIGIASNGVGPNSRLTVCIPAMTVLGVIEIIPVTPEAARILEDYPVWTA